MGVPDRRFRHLQCARERRGTLWIHPATATLVATQYPSRHACSLRQFRLGESGHGTQIGEGSFRFGHVEELFDRYTQGRGGSTQRVD